jgi:hypothetical protein
MSGILNLNLIPGLNSNLNPTWTIGSESEFNFLHACAGRGKAELSQPAHARWHPPCVQNGAYQPRQQHSVVSARLITA